MKRRDFIRSLAVAVVALPLCLPAPVRAAPDALAQARISDKAVLDAYWAAKDGVGIEEMLRKYMVENMWEPPFRPRPGTPIKPIPRSG